LVWLRSSIPSSAGKPPPRGAAIKATTVMPAQPATAQTYPSRQIELVVPFVAGGTTDTAARMIAQHLAEKWGQPAIVSNRPGGGSNIGGGREIGPIYDIHRLQINATGRQCQVILYHPTFIRQAGQTPAGFYLNSRAGFNSFAKCVLCNLSYSAGVEK
jgi:hypothetical protein